MAYKPSLQRFRQSKFKLNVLLDITKAINENRSTPYLLQKFVSILQEELSIRDVIIYINDGNWRLSRYSNYQGKAPKINVVKDLYKYKNITSLTNGNSPKLSRYDFIIPIYHKDKPLAFVMIFEENDNAGLSPTIKHLNFVQTLANVIIASLENKRLFKEIISQEKLKKELDLASKIQSYLIPKDDKLPNNNCIKTAATYLPHYDIGGDYYDFIKLNEHEYGFCIGDVSGKGISAALLMSNFQASLKALFTEDIEIEELVDKLNTITFNLTNGDRFLTLFIAKYNTETNYLTYVNAGHNPPLLYNKATRKVTYLENGTAGLGMLEKSGIITTTRIKLKQDTRFLGYTDGIVEVENKDENFYGVLGLEYILRKDYRLIEIIPELSNNVKLFRGNVPIADDISVICVDIYPQ